MRYNLHEISTADTKEQHPKATDEADTMTKLQDRRKAVVAMARKSMEADMKKPAAKATETDEKKPTAEPVGIPDVHDSFG